jgi:hypothetical protein
MLLALSEFLRMARSEGVIPAKTLPTPRADLADVSERLGQAWGVTSGETVAQYLAWSDQVGLFAILSQPGTHTLADIVAHSVLNPRGADALLCILLSLGLADGTASAAYSLSLVGRDYFLKDGQYYVGEGMFAGCDKPLPAAFARVASTEQAEAPNRWPDAKRLRIQHSRNFAPSVTAARSGEFDGVRHLVDVAGGSGVFAIPLALDHPQMRVTLIEVQRALDGTRQMLCEYGLEQRVDTLAMDIFEESSAFPRADGMLFGNIFHSYNDERCRFLATRAFRSLEPGGRIWLHEVVFNEGRNGPLLAALWNANMVIRSDGRQRQASELMALLETVGYEGCRAIPTAGRFCLVVGRKPEHAIT